MAEQLMFFEPFTYPNVSRSLINSGLIDPMDKLVSYVMFTDETALQIMIEHKFNQVLRFITVHNLQDRILVNHMVVDRQLIKDFEAVDYSYIQRKRDLVSP